jgi:hypothetical protein
MRQLALLIENQPQDHDGHPSFAQRFAVARFTHTSSIGRVILSYRSSNEGPLTIQSARNPNLGQISVKSCLYGIFASSILIRNGDDVSHSVSGWTVHDAAGHVYTFGTRRLGAGKLSTAREN